jgi:RNA polymerase sigma-70 factor, ECF subfamily
MKEYNSATPGTRNITELLEGVNRGDRKAESRLVSLVYQELRRVAALHMANERCNHTLQPTALVNEVYLRLLRQQNVRWQNRAHFFAIAAQLMRRVLIDYARTRTREKRGGIQHRVTLEEDNALVKNEPTDRLILVKPA